MRFAQVSLLLSAIWAGQSNAFVPLTIGGGRPRSSGLGMAIDYNDPVVAEEFNNVQPLSFEEVEAELKEKGIPVKPTMNEMEVKLMLVEMRLRLSGKLGGKTKKERPAKFSSKLEEFLWTKPAFEQFYSGLKAKGDNNALNVVTEYIQNPDVALQRYGKDYKGLIRKTEEALNAPPPVNSPTLTFSGCKLSKENALFLSMLDESLSHILCLRFLCFNAVPANMGEQGCLMTLQSLGAIEAFECVVDDDFPILRGTVTFEDIESAKKAVAQYNGMDMGMGTRLELASV